jgi:hypothetical protein
VAVNGREWLKDLDIFQEAGGGFRTLVKEWRGLRLVPVVGEKTPSLELRFTPKSGEPLICGVEVVELPERVLEGL